LIETVGLTRYQAASPRLVAGRNANEAMKDILNRFSLESAKISGQTNAIAVFLWCILVGCAIWSINTQPFNKKERTFWTAVVVFIPLAGLLCYLPIAWRNAATGSLSFWRKPRRGQQ
jgi:hypothetical protein